MKKTVFLTTFIFVLFLSISINPTAFCAEKKALTTNEPFEAYVLVDGLDNPWNILYGPDNMLWVTERMGKSIVRVNPKTGEKKVAVKIDEVLAAGGQQGILGMALAPDFLQTNSKNYVYVVYTYEAEQDSSFTASKKIARFEYDIKSEKLINPKTILDKIPAGNDHNGGRLVIDQEGFLYLSLGELGHNQGANFRLEIEAQRLPTFTEVLNDNKDAYVGKVLRIAPDGTIPNDNPVLNGVKSHVFTYGHRNPQGLTFVNDKLYSCEHGPSSDDELNLLVSGGNYGWPHVAGFIDDQAYKYANWSKAPKDTSIQWDANVIDPRVPVQNETSWPIPANFKEPLKTFYTVNNNYDFHDADIFGGLSYVMWPTIGPSSLIYYPENGPIKSWQNSIVMTTLKNGTIYVVKLVSTQENVQGDVMTFFHTPNRYRDICMSPDMQTFFIITDSSGSARNYEMEPTSQNQNPGAILVLKYKPQSTN